MVPPGFLVVCLCLPGPLRSDPRGRAARYRVLVRENATDFRPVALAVTR
jgi:hypothetical protein